ncbi:MAG TPA: SDR family oxidoreductase [Candidatus Cryosericum sp.]|nr:SDR family oxidoreductase [Candidatus Cryosericum sp.]
MNARSGRHLSSSDRQTDQPLGGRHDSLKEPVAIIGIGCRFPGASDPAAFWKLLRDGTDMITEVPADRFDIASVYDPRPAAPGKTQSRFGGFVRDVGAFDADFFRVSPREAARMDPQQRLLLDVAWDAFEDAGLVPDRLAGSRTGVFIGACASDYNSLQLYRDDKERIDIYSIAGGASAVLSGRVSYIFDLHGPSLTLDTACSSSLVAIYLAMQSLRTGDCGVALAGGVNLVLSPELSIGFSSARMLAPDGRCKAFDTRADGFVRSDGVGLVVLKRLSQAIADGDPIYALIRGGAINNDGQGSGMMMPNQKRQEAVVRRAYEDAGVLPSEIDYVEAHGTGTGVGDPIEAQALGAVLREGRSEEQPCLLGSVKTNIGHSEGAAGAAGVIKTALSLKHRLIPPSLHVTSLSPKIPWKDLLLTVPSQVTPWPQRPWPATAGVSSFGISGTNVHLVLSEAPESPAPRAEAGESTSAPFILPLSAHTKESLDLLARSYRAFLAPESVNGGTVLPDLDDICFTAGVRRGHHRHRAAFVGADRKGLVEQIDAFLAGETPLPAVSEEAPKLVFVFSGQGSQWLGMGRKLAERHPEFRASLEACDRAIRLHADWSLLEELAADEKGSRLDRVDVIQPTIFAMQVSLAALWRSFGIEPDAVVGQSLGEIAAAVVAGALSLEDGARVICERSRLVRGVGGKGAMAVVGLSLDEARRALSGYEEKASIAVSSSPVSTVLSGDPDALMRILDPLEQKGVFCRWINVDYASHGPQMDALRVDLPQTLAAIRPRAGTVPVYSTVTCEPCRGEEFDAAYWFRNIREPVLLADTMRRLLADGHRVFVEVSPHPVLTSTVQQCLAAFAKDGSVLPTMRNDLDERAVMLQSLASLYAAGRRVEWDAVRPAGGRPVRLPSLPRQREFYWYREPGEEAIPEARPQATSPATGSVNGKGLLGSHVESALHPGTHFFETEIGVDRAPYLSDHRVRGSVVLPAAAYVEMALRGSEQAFHPGPHALENVAFEKAFFLPKNGTRRLQLVITAGLSGTAGFRFISRAPKGGADAAGPTVHVTGTIRLNSSMSSAESAGNMSTISSLLARCAQSISRSEHYQAMESRGLQYGSSFQIVETIARQNGEALGRLALSGDLVGQAASYKVHPTLLDGCFQVLAALLPGDSALTAGRQTWLPVRVSRIRLNGSPVRGAWGHAVLKPDTDKRSGLLRGDLRLLDEQGRTVMEVSGLDLQRLDGRPAATPDSGDWFYEFAWRPKPRRREAGASAPASQRGSWLVLADSAGLGEKLAGLLRARGETAVVATHGESYAALGGDSYRVDVNRPDDLDRLLREAFGTDRKPCRGIVDLAGLSTEAPHRTSLKSLEADLSPVCGGALHLVQALQRSGWKEKPRLVLVTRGAQASDESRKAIAISQAPLWGLGRVIANENPELRCLMVDLDSTASAGDAQAILDEIGEEDGESQVALRPDGRRVARLVRAAIAKAEPGPEKQRLVPGDHPCRLESPAPGMLDSLLLRSVERRAPAVGEVEIRVLAAGLNFSDVMKAMGLYPGLPDGPIPLGIECSGLVTAVGEGVTHVAPGDEVVAITPFSFGGFVTTLAARVLPKPKDMAFDAAATIPIAFLTAWYALRHLARLERGERVLIHSATGGVGLAAVQIARHVGAEIFATAGTEEKREYLRGLGIEHVHDSRSPAFAREILERTGGEGVDAVLNSLSGEAIALGLSILRPYGRFLEIGKRDIYENSPLGLAAFKKNVSFFAVDLDHTMRERPALLGSLFADVMRLVEEGAFQPLPARTFPLTEAAQAFRHMSQARHIGKIVLTAPQGEIAIAPAAGASTILQAEGTYLLTGGLGGLGLAIAEWMSRSGAGALVLTGRSGASPEAERKLDALRRNGTRIEVVKADIADEAQVAEMLAEIGATLPPLRGIIHAAGILDDGTLPQMTLDRFRTVMAPKVRGAWNLHKHTSETPLDFFVLFSSASTVFGAAGQANYSAANAFLDALAYHRRSLGRPSLVINWGAWGEVGLASRPDRLEWLKRQGLLPLTNRQGVAALEQALRSDRIQLMINDIDWKRFLDFQPKDHASPLFAELREPAAAEAAAAPAAPATEAVAPKAAPAESGGLTRGRLLATDPKERRAVLESFLQEHVARILGLASSKLSPQRSLLTLGLDSLMATEIRNRIEASLGVSLPVTTLLQGCSVADLAKEVLSQVGAESPKTDDRLSKVLEQVDKLTPEQARVLLAQKKRELAERRQLR